MADTADQSGRANAGASVRSPQVSAAHSHTAAALHPAGVSLTPCWANTAAQTAASMLVNVDKTRRRLS